MLTQLPSAKEPFSSWEDSLENKDYVLLKNTTSEKINGTRLPQ